MFEHDIEKEQAYRFSRFDTEHLLSSASSHTILLDDENWKTAEHYLWANLVSKKRFQQQIQEADSAKDAFSIGSKWYRSKIKGWKKLRRIYMTRALYTKVQMYPEVKTELMATGDNKIIETSLYDHYWGIGRDQRGENIMGEIWMDIRKRLKNKSD